MERYLIVAADHVWAHCSSCGCTRPVYAMMDVLDKEFIMACTQCQFIIKTVVVDPS